MHPDHPYNDSKNKDIPEMELCIRAIEAGESEETVKAVFGEWFYYEALTWLDL